MTFNSEADFEKALVNLLFDKGWSKNVLKYKTEAELIENWAEILYNNNRGIDRLNNCKLTKGEMQQIIDQINHLRTPLRLNGFINGRTVTIKRDNEEDKLHFGKEVALKIYDRNEIAQGQSTYQIAEQPKFATTKMLNDRRGDIMLLINGMPVIHVELKKSGIPVSQACNQIEKYSHEGVFTGLFSLVQVFVAMQPEETVYFANPGPYGKFNKDFYFHWADNNNQPINDWRDIASDLISIPMAHEMIGFYTVPDNTDGVLKVMRSYQYFAAHYICDKVAKTKWDDNNNHGGYIWHTTGSGKTLTSFKSAQLIANSNDADKVVFLMDRVELSTQSLQDYRGFADDSESVQDTDNTNVLVTKLKSKNPADTLIVTSIQKMSRIDDENGFKTRDIQIINNKRIVFIVDEAHRDVFGEMLETIKKTFPKAIFFGFTGTPIMDENKKKFSTTSDVFGDELHRYIVADGIRDKNVLGFDPYKVMTYRDIDLRKAVALEMAKAKSEEEALADKKKAEVYFTYLDHNKVPMTGYLRADGTYIYGIEDYLTLAQYRRKEHQNAVVDDIIDNFIVLSHGQLFHALFATSSIPEAIDYYKLFKSKKTNLNVAALFDPNIDNNGGCTLKEDAIVEMLDDYDSKFGGDYTFATYPKYKKDVALRLAHKSPYIGIEKHPDKQIDILIVVDQMLTGFDSKWINTLYLDKLLRYEKLIQAFSRTNRLYGSEKPFGTIKYYRKPHTMEENIKAAFALYSGDKPLALYVDKLEENLKSMNDIFEDIASLFKASSIVNFEKLPDDIEEKCKFAKLFKKFNDHLEAAKIQGFTWDKEVYNFTDKDGNKSSVKLLINESTYLILALRYKELYCGGGGQGPDVPYDIDTHLTEINTGTIDADYMNSRFKKYLKALQDNSETEDILNELHKSFAALSQEDQKYANIFLHDVQRGDIIVEDGKTLREYINEYRSNAENDQIHHFACAIGVDENQLRDFMHRHITKDNINEYGLFDQLLATVEMETAKKYFEHVEGKTLKIYRVSAKVDAFLRKFILEGGFDI